MFCRLYCVFVEFFFFNIFDLVLQYMFVMVGYGDDEMKMIVLELIYNYGVIEYMKGIGYVQV